MNVTNLEKRCFDSSQVNDFHAKIFGSSFPSSVANTGLRLNGEGRRDKREEEESRRGAGGGGDQ
jgi:hypothetical protein